MTLPATAPFKAFAAIIGCRPSYVTELRKSGRLVLSDDGKAVRVAESIARIEATRDPAMKAVADRHAATRGAELAIAAPARIEAGEGAEDAAEDDDAAAGPDFHLWKSRRERAAALREEIKLAEDAKEYLRRDDAIAVVSNAFVTLRAELEALPDSIAPVLAGESDEQRVRVLLAEEIEHALGNLAEQIGKLGAKEA
ncbi:hypothetical protein ebA7281 [Aromatoleum aromaticum EbN1]|uniref:Terminase small subunit n=1 Tax=Aromatoleum aromaticum (strain DSM 19018 / LMG 30748 / EbN1) TaxID=76114 RepID=Q5NXG5_AROAE|nr:hypothetical protein [Aromatoleum aromaticum]CAI10249.1 hypothetical protein ebA7281 [Aromatoleum aromaticum EbN1]